MEKQPTKAYVYQPGPSKPGNDRIFGVAGPGTGRYQNCRMTKAEAQELADSINRPELTRPKSK